MNNIHPCIPKHLTLDEVLVYLKNEAVDNFTDTQKHYFTPEEISDFEHESSANGRETNRLNDIKKLVSDLVSKGNPEEVVTIEIPVTMGTKNLELFRRQNDDNIERQFEETKMIVYALPYVQDETMEFFFEDGKHIPDRSRPMSNKEKNQHVGLFQRKTLKVANGVDEETSEIVN